MRIGTWNVSYGIGRKNKERLALLRNHKANIWILTETHPSINLKKTHTPTPAYDRPKLGIKKVKMRSSWVTIWSNYPLLRRIAVPDPLRMVAGVFDAPGGPLTVAGVVLPWHDDVGDKSTNPEPKQWEEHRRVLRDEMPVLLRTMREESNSQRRVLAGDFNSCQAFPYPYAYQYPPKIHEDLRLGLAKLISNDSLGCHTANYVDPAPCRQTPPRTFYDHICTDLDPPKTADIWSGNKSLSDHPGVVIEWED